MLTPRRLVLTSERLTELTPTELESVNGGLPTDICITEIPTFICTVIVTIIVSRVTQTTTV